MRTTGRTRREGSPRTTTAAFPASLDLRSVQREPQPQRLQDRQPSAALQHQCPEILHDNPSSHIVHPLWEPVGRTDHSRLLDGRHQYVDPGRVHDIPSRGVHRDRCGRMGPAPALALRRPGCNDDHVGQRRNNLDHLHDHQLAHDRSYEFHNLNHCSDEPSHHEPQYLKLQPSIQLIHFSRLPDLGCGSG